jgi:hypothetical protein
MADVLVGYLLDLCGVGLKGHVFSCSECAAPSLMEATGSEEFVPTPIKVFEVNVRPYSQTCHFCNKLVVDGIKKTGTNNPLNLFGD